MREESVVCAIFHELVRYKSDQTFQGLDTSPPPFEANVTRTTRRVYRIYKKNIRLFSHWTFYLSPYCDLIVLFFFLFFFLKLYTTTTAAASWDEIEHAIHEARTNDETTGNHP